MASKRTGLRERTLKAALTAADTGSKKGAKAPPIAEGEVVQITARLPVDFHNKVRDYAHFNRVSINSLMLEGLEWAMKQKR